MGDELLTDDDIDDFCTCAQANKGNAIEYQVPHNTPFQIGWKTAYYVHKDCPLHGMIRLNYTHANGVPNAGSHPS